MAVYNTFDDCGDCYVLEEGYLMTDLPFPVTNHVNKIDRNNIGWIRGITVDGLPFEAEYWKDGKTEGLDILLPVIYKDIDCNPVKKSNIIPFCYTEYMKSSATLCIGMVLEGVEEELSEIQKYTEYLKCAAIITYTSECENGYVDYVTDVSGNTFARVSITIIDDGEELAFTSLKFVPFKKGKNMFRCV